MEFKSRRQMYNYWLSTAHGLTPLKRQALIESAPSLDELFCDKSIIKSSKFGIKDEVKQNLLSRANEDLLNSELHLLKSKGIRITTPTDDDYPDLLSQIHNPPTLLYYKGELSRLSYTRLAVVGTRRPSYRGIENAKKICEQISKSGISIISGLANGIDTVAAKAAIKGGTPTAAVLGSGIDVIYPKDNALLYDQICESGVILSEYPPGTPPLAENFPPRNRIISGMSQAVFIVEGKIKSGGAITVRNAIEQNRDVFALPGDISNPLSELPNTLISDGAIIVLGANTILESFNLGSYNPIFNEKTNIDLDISEQHLYTLLKQGEFSAEQLSELSGMDISKTNLTLTMLEIKKAVTRLPGNIFALNR